MIKSLLIVGYGSIGKRHARIARDLFPHTKIIILRHKVSKARNRNVINKTSKNT
jgi:lactate dehydrogenase-like 2-hydroxyacid dehydrogenase